MLKVKTESKIFQSLIKTLISSKNRFVFVGVSLLVGVCSPEHAPLSISKSLSNIT